MMVTPTTAVSLLDLPVAPVVDTLAADNQAQSALVA